MAIYYSPIKKKRILTITTAINEERIALKSVASMNWHLHQAKMRLPRLRDYDYKSIGWPPVTP